MIWSCEINYSGWEDDIHHHHFFIESDTKPTEKEVAEHYNQTLYNPKDYRYDTWIQACPKEDEYDTGWEGLDTYGDVTYEVSVTVEEIKPEKLVPLTKIPKFKKPTKEMLECREMWGNMIMSLFNKPRDTDEDLSKELSEAKSFFSNDGIINDSALLGSLKYGQQLDVNIGTKEKKDGE